MAVGSRFVIESVLCLGCSVALCFSQTQTTARITGNVRDITGAFIVKAEIVARSNTTGEKRSTSTTQSGEYALNSLPPGAWQVTISTPGFSAAKYTGVLVEIGTTVELDSVLKVANAASEVTVSDMPAQVHADSAEIATSIDAKTLAELPLPTRNILQLAALAPGVSMPLTDNSSLGRNSPNFYERVIPKS